MYISKFQILNFKSYRDSNEIEFKPGFNIITGQNNAGKTALLEALTLQIKASPHRSLRSVPDPGNVAPEECLKETSVLWTGYFVMPYREKLDDLHGRPMVNIVSRGTFYIYDKSSSTSPKTSGWLSLGTMEDEINQLLSRAESKFCTPNGSTCTSKTIGLLVRRHVVAGEFHYIGKEASTRWAGGPDLSMMAAAGALDPADETSREYERVVDPKYLEEIRAEAK